MPLVRKRRRTASRIDPRIFIIIGVLIAVIGVLLFILLYHGREEITERGMMMFSLKGSSAVVIRDEQILSSDEYARLDYLKEEGSGIMGGETLARVYKLGFSEELTQSLLTAREEVYKVQMERIGSTKDARLDELNASIEAIRKRVGEHNMLGRSEDLFGLCMELDLVLKERMEYLKDKVQDTETLRALYKKVEEREALISAWTEEITAPSSGVVSYYFDGYEQAVNSEKLGMLSPDLVERAISAKGSSSWTTNDMTSVCRVVNKNHWYLAFLTKSADLTRTARGIEYEVTVSGYGTFKAVALEPMINGDDVVNILELSEDIGDLIDVRSVKIDVSGAVNGIKVKSEAIRKEKGLRYLELLLSDSHYTIGVDVLAEENGMVIIRPHEENDALNEGVRYWNRK